MLWILIILIIFLFIALGREARADSDADLWTISDATVKRYSSPRYERRSR